MSDDREPNMSEGRCEPPPEWRDRDGWHWVQFEPWPARFAEWQAAHHGGRQPLWKDYERQRSCTPDWAAREWGWRYIAPVTPPATVAALVEALEAMASAANHENWHLDCVLAKVLSDATSALAAYREAAR